MARASAAVVLALALPLACSRTNPFFCAGSPNGVCLDAASGSDGGGSDAMIDARRQTCGSAADCTGDPSTPACDTGLGLCEPCTGSDLGVCGDQTPVCSNDNCVACGSDGDCGSGACLPSGACADESNVLFAAPNGTGNCSQADPCSFFIASTEVSASKNVIDLAPGNYDELGTTLAFTQSVTVLGHGAVVTSAAVPIIEIDGGSAELNFLTVSNGNGDGIDCENTASLKLVRATVLSNAGVGVDGFPCIVDIRRSTIAKNTEGGISVAGGSLVLENSFVVLNGSSSNETVGGVVLEPDRAGSRIVFDTIAYNQQSSGAGSANDTSPGVQCSNSSDSPAVVQSIVTANIVSGRPSPLQALGCNATGLTFTKADDSGSNNLGFVNITRASFDFHLTGGSPVGTNGVVDIPGDNGSDCVGQTDFDGGTRPVNGLCDFGADELGTP